MSPPPRWPVRFLFAPGPGPDHTTWRITCRAMSRPAAVLACAALVVLAGCGSGKIEVPKQDAVLHRGAVLFNERCSGCHTLQAADARGSRPTGQVKNSERTDGPNFDIRKENRVD